MPPTLVMKRKQTQSVELTSDQKAAIRKMEGDLTFVNLGSALLRKGVSLSEGTIAEIKKKAAEVTKAMRGGVLSVSRIYFI